MESFVLLVIFVQIEFRWFGIDWPKNRNGKKLVVVCKKISSNSNTSSRQILASFSQLQDITRRRQRRDRGRWGETPRRWRQSLSESHCLGLKKKRNQDVVLPWNLAGIVAYGSSTRTLFHGLVTRRWPAKVQMQGFVAWWPKVFWYLCIMIDQLKVNLQKL